VLYDKEQTPYVPIPIFKHGKPMKDETESGEVRENWVRESDCRNSIELRTTRVDQQ